VARYYPCPVLSDGIGISIGSFNVFFLKSFFSFFKDPVVNFADSVRKKMFSSMFGRIGEVLAPRPSKKKEIWSFLKVKSCHRYCTTDFSIELFVLI
jgi:hypothetical protein